MKEIAKALSIGGVDMTRHDLSRAFGDMPEDEYRELVESVERDGVGDPAILVIGTEVLDGWHRCRAALEAGRADELAPTPVYSGMPRLDMIKLVAKANLHRRHMTPQLRAQAITHLTSYEDDGEIRWETSVREDAETSGASPATVGRARQQAVAEHEANKAKAAEEEPPPLPGMLPPAPNVSSETDRTPGITGATPNFGGGGGSAPLPPADDAIAAAKAGARPKRGRAAKGRSTAAKAKPKAPTPKAKPQAPVATPVGSVAPSAGDEALRREVDNLTDIVHALGGHGKLGEEQRNLVAELDATRTSRDGWMEKHAAAEAEADRHAKEVEAQRKLVTAAEKRAGKADELKAKLAEVRKELTAAKRDLKSERTENARLAKANTQIATKLATAESKLAKATK